MILTIPAGNKSVYFDIKIDPTYLPDDVDEIRFKLDSAGTAMSLGTIREHTIRSGGLVDKYMDLKRGDNGKNRVFIIFEKATAVVIDRNSWDLGFYTGQEDHRVILNSATGMMAFRLNKNDMNNVSGESANFIYKKYPQNYSWN